ncbi:hypothetical protein K490DRAFT_63056 [Saccharata proteae CBS 121410]|uniref:Arb2 domain-containing protein n=1 Tax=Saccharata proteae CBS 121410 TaxID=1314787 RepID=A0A9P4HW01_9PEZI|nr:hypothetical protein K490DRAFT_63056 [Saccharata proteae CBS 121410]
MYRLLKAGLPADPTYTDKLNEMGYFIDADGAVRKIRPPHGTFQYWISNNERVNDTHREAFHRIIMREIESRVAALGFSKLWLPQLTDAKPKNEPSVPILLPKKEELKKKKRVVVVVNEDFQDLGSMAFRLLTKEAGIEAGSMVALAKEMFAGNSEQKEAAPDKISQPGWKHRQKMEEMAMKEMEEERQKAEAKTAQPDASADGAAPSSADPSSKEASDKKSHKATENAPVAGRSVNTTNAKFEVPGGFKTPGLVMLNTGQLYYSHEQDRAMNNLSWSAKPRMSGASPLPPIDQHFNKIAGNRDIDEHVKFVFDHVISSSDWISDDAELYLIGAANGGDALLRFLDNEWAEYKHRVVALALAHPTPIQSSVALKNAELVDFLRHRCRSMEVSLEPYLTPLAVPTPSKQKESEKAKENPNEGQSSRGTKQSIWIQNIRPTNTIGSTAAVHHGTNDYTAREYGYPPSETLSNISQPETIKAQTSESTKPTESGDWGIHYFPRFSSGVPTFGECILASTYKYMLSWFEEVAAHPNSYKNPEFEVPVQAVAGMEVEDTEVFDTAITPKVSVEDVEDNEISDPATGPKEQVEELHSPAEHIHGLVPEAVITPSQEADVAKSVLSEDATVLDSPAATVDATVTGNDENEPPVKIPMPTEIQKEEQLKEADSVATPSHKEDVANSGLAEGATATNSTAAAEAAAANGNDEEEPSLKIPIPTEGEKEELLKEANSGNDAQRTSEVI